MKLRTTTRAALALALAAMAGCEPRTIEPRGATWDDVAPVVEAACVSCHGAERAEGGYRLDGYLHAIACPASAEGVPAVEPPSADAPLLAALERDDHAGHLDARETALLGAWVEGGAPARIGAAHPSGWIDPRSPEFHGAALRAEGWARMRDPEAPGACARCHAGVGTDEPPRTTGVAPGATACTDCHRDQRGPFACSTCHGTPGSPHPPRDPCFHPDEAARAGAHAAHTRAGVACAVCHGERTIEMLAGELHGNGRVELAFDPARAGVEARFDTSAGTCANACHDRGGTHPVPAWQTGGGLDCGSCHQSPPADHYPGRCSSCHAEANADGTALAPGPLHANGRIDLGDGSGGCGACHGEADDPTPRTGAHAAHAMPSVATPIGCEACHVVPERVDSPGHLDDVPGAEVRFGERARARGASPTYDAGTCRDVACHGAGLGGGTVVAPRWYGDEPIAGRCGACHGLPPPAPHPDRAGCSTLGCHGAYATPGPGISELGRAVHIDGEVDLWR